ncbi:hypothetical protein BTA51_00225 [Hahella sp. CCB-MM4]|nr:hypothetical protein BTA51_00225 [Hahella sp. CCB-MM4]
MYAISLLIPVAVFAEPMTVKVGAYEFPPYFYSTHAKAGPKYEGATVALVDAINAIQSDIRLEIYLTSPKRRYLDFDRHQYDLIMFESLIWGWEGYPLEASRVFMGGGEVYVALEKPGRDQNFFNDVGSRSLVGILGYHYGFSNYISDDEYLNTKYRVFLSSDHERNLQLILLDRPSIAEVAIVTRSYLNLFMRDNPDSRGRFLVSEKCDQEYRHTILTRKQGVVSVEDLNRWLDILEKNGKLADIREKFGLVTPDSGKPKFSLLVK